MVRDRIVELVQYNAVSEILHTLVLNMVENATVAINSTTSQNILTLQSAPINAINKFQSTVAAIGLYPLESLKR